MFSTAELKKKILTIFTASFVSVYCFSFMAAWADDEGPRDAFSSDFEPLFDIPVPQNEIFLSLVNCPAVIQNHATPVIKTLSKGFLEVLNLQPKDFLPHGKYHAVVDADLCGRLSHSKLTNITGEQYFGDLDFSLFKQRNAPSVHTKHAE